jgi:short-subunit dehydrogenase
MNGKTVVITGGTSGIGEVAAEELARMGARIVLVARDKARANATLARLRQRGPRLAHSVHYADLHCARSISRQRTTPCTAGIGPLSIMPAMACR